MTREQVWKAVGERLRQDFGRLLEVRDVRRVRRVAGDAWTVSVVLAAPSGDLHVADLSVEDSGLLSPELDGDHVIEAVRRAERASMRPPSPSEELIAFQDELAEEDTGDLGPALALLTESGVGDHVQQALERGDEASLLAARELLPRLLAQHDRRGATLLALAEVEHRLGQSALARGYLEAAAREFADRFDLDSLEKAAGLALELSGREAFKGSPVQRLLEQSRTRLQPVASIYESRSFAWLPEPLRAKLEQNLTLRTLAAGETLVSEGEPSRNVFVVKSGLVGVWLEKPSGGSWLVRCCFPGWLLGEGSVLGGDNPVCMATLRAERISEVWVCSADVVRELMFEDLAFGQRIAETKQLHRIDSFFSMHETMGQLDVQVRDELLACMQRLESFEEDTLLLPAHKVPTVACLVARGAIALFEDGKTEPRALVEADSFYGVRDTIHRIESSFTAIARAGTTVAFFDGARLQALCERSPENVVAVLERLG
jgi:CRP-like cAMP-binding protein